MYKCMHIWYSAFLEFDIFILILLSGLLCTSQNCNSEHGKYNPVCFVPFLPLKGQLHFQKCILERNFSLRQPALSTSYTTLV